MDARGEIGSDLAKVANVAGDGSVAELQGGCGDRQIVEGDGHALGGLVALDATGQPGRLDGDRMHWHVADRFIDERLPPLPADTRVEADGYEWDPDALCRAKRVSYFGFGISDFGTPRRLRDFREFA